MATPPKLPPQGGKPRGNPLGLAGTPLDDFQRTAGVNVRPGDGPVAGYFPDNWWNLDPRYPWVQVERPPLPTLEPLEFDPPAPSILTSLAQGELVARVLNYTPGSVRELAPNGGKYVLNGEGNIVRGLAALAAGTDNLQITETLLQSTNQSLTSPLAITVAALPKPIADVALVWGQSNNIAAATTDPLPVAPGTYPNVPSAIRDLLPGGALHGRCKVIRATALAWQDYVPSVNSSNQATKPNAWGPIAKTAVDYLNANPGKNFWIIDASIGGSGMASWANLNGANFGQLRTAALAAIADLEAQGYEVRLMDFCQQGEADAIDAPGSDPSVDAAAWGANYDIAQAAIQSEFGSVRSALGLLFNHRDYPWRGLVRNAMLSRARSRPDITLFVKDTRNLVDLFHEDHLSLVADGAAAYRLLYLNQDDSSATLTNEGTRSVPLMLSDTTPAGNRAESSSVAVAGTTWKAFNKSEVTSAQASADFHRSAVGIGTGNWFTYRTFPVDGVKRLAGVRVYLERAGLATDMPDVIQLAGSKTTDAAQPAYASKTWVNLRSLTGLNFDETRTHFHEIPLNSRDPEYLHWRLNIRRTTGANQLSVWEIEPVWEEAL